MDIERCFVYVVRLFGLRDDVLSKRDVARRCLSFSSFVVGIGSFASREKRIVYFRALSVDDRQLLPRVYDRRILIVVRIRMDGNDER